MDTQDATPVEQRDIRFAGARLPWHLIHLETIGSTSDYLKQSVRRLPDRTVVAADRQTAGRGRLGRSWSSPHGGLYMSILFKPSPPPEYAPRLSLLAADVLCDLLAEAGISAEVKWPNDIVTGSRKIAGILPEGGSLPSPWMVLGVGLNIAIAPEIPDGRALEASCWGAWASPPASMDVLASFLRRLDEVWPDRDDNPLEGRLGSLHSRLWCLGHLVRMTRGPESVVGTVSGIDPEGRLLLATSSGMQAFDSGELRPV